MVPFVKVVKTIAGGMSAHPTILFGETGLEGMSRYIHKLLLSDHKTLQEIHAQQAYWKGKAVNRQAMHAAIFEAGWDSKVLVHTAPFGEAIPKTRTG